LAAVRWRWGEWAMSDGNLRQGPWSPTNAADGGGVNGGGSGAQLTGMEV
jgi:hypothetical protein